MNQDHGKIVTLGQLITSWVGFVTSLVSLQSLQWFALVVSILAGGASFVYTLLLIRKVRAELALARVTRENVP